MAKIATIIIAICAVVSLSLELYERLFGKSNTDNSENLLYDGAINEYKSELMHIKNLSEGNYESSKLNKSWFVDAPFFDIKRESQKLLKHWKWYVPSNIYRRYLLKRIIKLSDKGLNIDPHENELGLQKTATKLDKSVNKLLSILNKKV